MSRRLERSERMKAAADQLRAGFELCRPCVLSSLAFSLMTVCVKQLGGRLPVAEVVLCRALISVVLTAVGLLSVKLNCSLLTVSDLHTLPDANE